MEDATGITENFSGSSVDADYASGNSNTTNAKFARAVNISCLEDKMETCKGER